MLNINQITAQFKQALQVLYGERLDKLILYGSYARNEATEDSDVDLLVVLKDEEISSFKEIDKIVDATHDLNENFGFAVSVHPITQKRFLTSKTPFLYFVRKEGILI